MKIFTKQNMCLYAVSALLRRSLHLFILSGLALTAGTAMAQENAIESVSSTQQGRNVIVKIGLKEAPAKAPIGFAITNPARIAVDLAGTVNGTGKSMHEINLGDVRNVNVVQAGERSRLVFNLNRPMGYATKVEGKVVTLTIGDPEKVASTVPSPALKDAAPAAAEAPANPVRPPVAVAERRALRDIDFRKGSSGEGRVVVELPDNQIAVDVRQEGKHIVVDFIRATLPDVMRRRLDVTDFGTPVSTITARPHGENVRMIIEGRGLWEHSAYQSDSQLVIDVKPVKEDPNKLVQGRGYKGERLSLNFQSVDVRAVLQVIADFTGLNIITSDTVTGNLTLRLKEVPWDQALDIVMQAKGLDMRKNGNVLWIAPKDELLTKEKLELEQKALISDLEPLKTEVFQLNYLKAADFRKVFGLVDNANSKQSILSKRGSVASETRSNKLFVTDTASKIEEIRKLLLLTDMPTRQVMIEARIVEASDTFNKSLGVKLGFSTGGSNFRVGSNAAQTSSSTATATSGNYAVSLPATTSGGTAATVGLSLFNSSATKFLNLELSALEADGKGKIISSPRVVTADQQKALIEQGEEIPYQNATSSGATSVEFKKATLKLEVTPQITPDGNVILTVDVNKDSRGTTTNGVPAINTKHVQTNVQVENGGTVVIGGIFTQTDTKDVSQVPLLGDIPVLGNLFKTTTIESDKTELLIFLTPKIITDQIEKR